MTDPRSTTPAPRIPAPPAGAPRRAEPYPRWKVELFRTRTADLQARGAAHATGRAARAPGIS